jgi:WD40 repeat protein/DNA-binding SARP family transcriptional activator
VEFRILGPLEVRSESRTLGLGGIKPRALLAVLLMHPNEPVHAERLAVALWGEDAPASAAKTVQVYVSRLRKEFDDSETLSTTPAGYCLRVRPGELDAERFARLVEDGCHALAAGEAEHAADVLREALALWRGPPLADFAFEAFAQTEIARLQEQRLAAVEARIEADLAAGRHPALVGELRQLVAGSPTRERLAGQLMLALYRCGQQADALEAYHVTRRVLEEIGVQPGSELRRLQEAILRQDRSLEPPAAVSELPPELDTATEPPLEGRDGELAWLRERWERARTRRGTLVTVAGVRGIGKSRLAAELADEVNRHGAEVLYANGAGPAERALVALARAREAIRPTLLVVDDADQAGTEVLAELVALARALASSPVLALASGRDADALARLGAADALTLEPLDAQAVRAIAVRYAPGHVGVVVPVDWLFGASGGIPRRVHDAARQWARREAARRVGAGAERTATGRAELRSMESELAGDVVELQAADERGATDDESPTVVVCPFKGLASFDVVDAPYFFGRERLVAELVARLVGAPLLGVVGPSGSGKSSVMRAGLLPALASGVLPGSDTWTQALIRPGEHPLRALNEAMTGTGDAARVVLAVDQFEETFTTCEDEAERAAFIAELARVAGEVESHSVVVIALRADYYGRCAAYPELAAQLASNHVLVRSMQRDELRRAIKLPAQRVGLRVDPELAEALVADVKDEPGALPLLSTALLELWQRRDGRRLRYTVYEQTGGVDGAVARLAEDAFGELDDEQQVIARGILMRLAGEGAAGGVERRRVALTELETDRNEDGARIVALLTDRRLLTASSGTIELAHEALMREWPRLRDWIDADREGLRIHRNLNAAAREWEGLGRDDGALYRGVRLTEAIEWAEAQQPRLNETERAFLEACMAGQQRERVMRRRRMSLTFGSLAVVLVAISVVAVVSIVQGRRTASRELANRSATVLASDPPLALAIGREAVRRYDTTEAQNAVRQATLADRETAVIRAHPVAVYRAALSPDGSRIATAGDDGLVRILSVHGARALSTIRGHKHAAIDVSFSPDGKHVASVGIDGEVAISELDGEPRRVVLRLRGGIYARSVEYDSTGRRLLIAVTDGTIRLIRLSDSHWNTFARHKGIRAARFDRDGRRVLSAGDYGQARIWDATGHEMASLFNGKDVDLYDASFSPDGRRVATAGSDGALRIWSARSGRLLHKIALDLQPLYSVQFSPDGRRVVTGGADGAVRVSDIRGGPVLTEIKGHHDRVYDAGFMGDSGHVYSAGTDGTVRIWALPKTATLPVDEAGAPFAPSFSPDGTLVVSGYDNGEVRLWNPTTNSQRRIPGPEGDSGALYSANGAYILSFSSLLGKGTVRLYDVKRHTSTLARVPAGSEEYAGAIDHTGHRIARAGLAKRAVIQAPDGTHRLVLPDIGQVNSLAFSPNGAHLVSASNDGSVRTWNTVSGASERVLKGIDGAALWVTYSPDGKHVAAAGADGAIRIWRLAGGEPIVLYGHDGPVTTVGYDPGGDRLVSGGKDGTVRIWDAATGQPLVVLHRHEGEVSGVAFSPNGRDVISGADDGLRVSACEVCGTFSDLLALATTRPDVTLTAAERTRLVAGGG